MGVPTVFKAFSKIVRKTDAFAELFVKKGGVATVFKIPSGNVRKSDAFAKLFAPSSLIRRQKRQAWRDQVNGEHLGGARPKLQVEAPNLFSHLGFGY